MPLRSTFAIGDLRNLERPFVTTGEAATRLALSESATSHLLRRLAEDGLVVPLRRGLWSLVGRPDPLLLAGWITAPYPSYASLWTALSAHGALSQIPRDTYVVSLGRPRTIETSVGVFRVHQVAPQVFGGFRDEGGARLATITKAVFDIAYLAATHGPRFARLPELDLAAGYRPKEARTWLAKIASPRIRSLVDARLGEIEVHSRPP